MKCAFLRAGLGLALLCLSACNAVLEGSGTPASEVREVPAFSGVQIRDALVSTVTVRPGEEARVVLSGDDNLLPYVSTRVVEGVLVVEMTEPYFQREPLRADITVPALGQLAASGTATVTADGVSADLLRVSTTGSAVVQARGTAARLEVSASGDSTIEAHELSAEDVDVAGSEAAGVAVCARARLALRLSGSSRTEYWCAPGTVTRALSGSARAEPR